MINLKKGGRRAARMLLTGAAVIAAGSLAVPGARAQTAPSLAGFNVSGTSVAEQFQLNSPGLLPVGDATTGNIFEVDLPFARINAASGPQVDALGSPLYPGDTAAHLGTAVGTFGGPDLPNDPVVADAQYPPTPDNSTKESFSTPASKNGAFSMDPGSSQSNAAADGASVTSTVGQIDLGPAVGSAANLVTVQGSQVTNLAHIAATSVDITSASSATGIDIAGIIQIAQVQGSASADSDGSAGTPSTGLTIGKVTVAGQPAYIDQAGVHLAGQSQGAGPVAFANSLLDNLAAYGVTVHTVSPTETTDGPLASADSGAVEVSITGRTPSIPGMPPPAPGLPPTPGVTSLPYQVNVLIGGATASATATPLPAFPDLSAGTLGTGSGSDLGSAAGSSSPAPAGDLGGAAGLGAPAPSMSPSTETVPPSGPGSSQQAAGSLGNAVLAGVGHPVPMGLAALILVLALMSSGGLLAYARWQLIDGRRR